MADLLIATGGGPEYRALMNKLLQVQAEITSLKRARESDSDSMDTPPAKRQRLSIPPQCQRACRTVIKKLEEDPTFTLSFSSYGENEPAMLRVQREVRRRYTDRNWSIGTIAEACKRIWQNMRDDHAREHNGKKREHRSASRASKRIRDKLRRQKALRLGQWSEEERRDTEAILKKEFMSPERTDDEEDTATRFRLPFVWESSSLARRKAELDRLYRESLTTKAKKMLFRVDDHPKGTPSWAISRKY